jgi:hypothetical protein
LLAAIKLVLPLIILSAATGATDEALLDVLLENGLISQAQCLAD